jgi:hypothetical protein
MAITLKDIQDAVTTYFHTRLVASIEVRPLPAGSSKINPGERFSIHLVATNSKNNPAQAVRITNVRYQVRIEDDKMAKLIVPSSLSVEARSGPFLTSPKLEHGDEVKEMFLFPPDSTLEPGDTDLLPLEGHALALGTPNVNLHLWGDVDVLNRNSIGSNKQVPIVPKEPED